MRSGRSVSRKPAWLLQWLISTGTLTSVFERRLWYRMGWHALGGVGHEEGIRVTGGGVRCAGSLQVGGIVVC